VKRARPRFRKVAFTFAHAIAYVQAAIDAGLDVNRFGQRVSFFFNAHNDFSKKSRSSGRRGGFGRGSCANGSMPRTRARSSSAFTRRPPEARLTAQQPDNNIVRVALQAMAAVLGGTQSLHCNGRDEALALPTEDAARIALRTQQVIATESGVVNTVDPVAGSYAIEALTNTIERGAREILDRIEHAGGTLAAIESGFIQREIQESAYRAQLAVDSGPVDRRRGQPG
jgi:methylmalonyl-CoA mutase N-terminal domain/subunit